MSHFGRSGPPDIRDTYSLLVLNISFRTSADDLFPLFDRYGKVVDVFIPRDRRSGDSRGFAFVRYKHSKEAQKAIEHLDGRNVDGRNISVQFAKYGREMELIQKGRITRENFNWKRSRSRSPRRSRYRDEIDDYRGNGLHDQDRYPRHERASRRHRSRSRARSRSRSPGEIRGSNKSREDDRRNPRRRTPDRRSSPLSSRDTSLRKRSASPRKRSASPRKRSASPRKQSLSPMRVNRSSRSASPRKSSSMPCSEGPSQRDSPLLSDKERASSLQGKGEYASVSRSPSAEHPSKSPSLDSDAEV
ncbi:hypothetical protein KP509_26G043800 [Ceratopteris richardii]|uniref:RRM domain-containing protein n=1 Tax=Ceratopteris richardii TaxID=49495 RepID=A0A8T2RMS1_CERRI|nr:hypothetical protein KP509_26G043800 [Ceratopteris richardii]